MFPYQVRDTLFINLEAVSSLKQAEEQHYPWQVYLLGSEHHGLFQREAEALWQALLRLGTYHSQSEDHEPG